MRFSTRIFISYAREDHSLAKSIHDLLAARRFTVFLDTEGTIGGEDFVRRITEELRGSDAMIALLTPASLASEWCRAEWYFAHARGTTVIPIRVGDVEALIPDPIRLLEQRIHFLSAIDVERQTVGPALAEQLDAVRRARRRRAFLKVSVWLAIIAAIVVAAYWLVDRAEWIAHLRERNRLVARLTAASQPIPGDDLARQAARFTGDETLLATTLRMATDPELSDAARINAVMLSSELMRNRKPEQRWALRNLKWRNGLVRGGILANATFVSGTIERLTARSAMFASVYWGRELTLSNASFQNVRFESGGFAGTNAIRLDFLACLFHGVELDVTNFALARFRSVPADPNHPNVVNAGEVCAFESSVIVNTAQPPAVGTLDLSTPADEIQFDGVVFTAVHFRGYIRPEWFKNCSFDRCVLPSSLTVAALERGGNRVTDSVHADESFY